MKGGRPSAKDLKGWLRGCQAEVAAWCVGISHNALGMGGAPRNDDRSYDASEVVAYYVAKAKVTREEGKGEATAQEEARTVKLLIENGERMGLLLHKADVDMKAARAFGAAKQALEAGPHTWVPRLFGKSELEMKAELDRVVWDILVNLEGALKKLSVPEGGAKNEEDEDE